MKHAIFEIKKNAVNRYFFVFREPDNTMMITSKSYADRTSLENCIVQIRQNAKVADVSEESQAKVQFPSFVIYKSKTGYSFALHGIKGEIIFSSSEFSERKQCMESIQLLKENAFDAKIYDMT